MPGDGQGEGVRADHAENHAHTCGLTWRTGLGCPTQKAIDGEMSRVSKEVPRGTTWSGSGIRTLPHARRYSLPNGSTGKLPRPLIPAQDLRGLPFVPGPFRKMCTLRTELNCDPEGIFSEIAAACLLHAQYPYSTDARLLIPGLFGHLLHGFPVTLPLDSSGVQSRLPRLHSKV